MWSRSTRCPSFMVLVDLLVAITLTLSSSRGAHAFSLHMSSTTSLSLSSSVPNKGSAARPYEKKKAVVFGAGGYLGGCIYGMLQRAGSLYGTGISGVGGSPRAVVATGTGSVNLNGILSNNFILAQADETFVRTADMTSVEAVQERVRGFDVAILGTRCSLEDRPVTLGTYEKTPNDKTKEFYMERPRMSTSRVLDDPSYSMQIFQNTVEACAAEGIKHLLVVETDLEFDEASDAGDKYLQLLNERGTPFTYVKPMGKLGRVPDFTYANGVQQTLQVSQPTMENSASAVSASTINREDLAALCVQSLMTLEWRSSRILHVAADGSSLSSIEPVNPKSLVPQKEWCVNSEYVRGSLAGIL